MTKTNYYVAIVEHDEGSLYGVRFPDLKGCYSAGKTVDEAARNAVEAVRLWADDALNDGEALPEPRPLDVLAKEADVREALATGGVTILVPLYRSTGRLTRINVSLDSGDLAAIDDAAAHRGLTRSGFLIEAAREKIAG